MDTLREMENDRITICTKCKHFINLEPSSPRKDVWYNHVCKASKRPKKIDPYDGKIRFISKNDLGNEITTDNPYEYCRYINNGNCYLFEDKNGDGIWKTFQK